MKTNTILFLIPDWAIGGMPVVAHQMIEHFETRFDVKLLLINDKKIKYDLPEGIEVYTGFPEGKNIFGKMILFFKRLIWLKQCENRTNADLVISFGVLAGVLNILANRKKAFVTEHNVKSIENTQWGPSGIAFKWLIRWLYPKAQILTTVSEGVNQDLKRNFGVGNAKTIYNPNQISIRRLSNGNSLPKDIEDLVGNTNYFVYVGRLASTKQVDLIIRGFANRTNRQLKLLIIGNGELENELKELVNNLEANNDVIFLGARDDVLNIMRHAIGTVLYSKNEGLPNVLIESLAVGTKVLSGDSLAGPREILSNGEFSNYCVSINKPVEFQNGVLLPLLEGQSAVDCLSKCFDNWPLINGKIIDISNFYAENVFNQYDEVVDSFFKNHLD